ncbi:hypothetical protein RF11_10120 [Thelohanellus kitauei]|uniref:Uncharacterized protein n=1 Tax=Thelohanellus kitauei TaxID=669202 RepID=A0A0C2ITV6_THEKT|nr:hypothetical protein RF11_10120 [Thelohanellus kitauei]
MSAYDATFDGGCFHGPQGVHIQVLTNKTDASQSLITSTDRNVDCVSLPVAPGCIFNDNHFQAPTIIEEIRCYQALDHPTRHLPRPCFAQSKNVGEFAEELEHYPAKALPSLDEKEFVAILHSEFLRPRFSSCRERRNQSFG